MLKNAIIASVGFSSALIFIAITVAAYLILRVLGSATLKCLKDA